MKFTINMNGRNDNYYVHYLGIRSLVTIQWARLPMEGFIITFCLVCQVSGERVYYLYDCQEKEYLVKIL